MQTKSCCIVAAKVLSMKNVAILTAILAILLFCFGYTKSNKVTFAEASAPEGGSAMSFAIQTNAFAPGSVIPNKYTCDGSNVSPELTWSGAPAGTQAFALIVDDPDAPGGTWTHWTAWNIPANSTKLAEGTPKNETLADGTRQGRNDFKRIGYNGPCPPPGKPHRYFFKVYALGANLDAKAGASRGELESAMKGKTLGQAEVMGKYGR
jgi:Raf kinase inhibitor-like YbhB/YbcL family protein